LSHFCEVRNLVMKVKKFTGNGLRLILRADAVCQSRHKLRQNKVAELAQQRKIAGGWVVLSLIIHALACGNAQTCRSTILTPQLGE
jgi:hypothetical protein